MKIAIILFSALLLSQVTFASQCEKNSLEQINSLISNLDSRNPEEIQGMLEKAMSLSSDCGSVVSLHCVGKVTSEYGAVIWHDFGGKEYAGRITTDAELEVADDVITDFKQYDTIKMIRVKVLNDKGYGQSAIGKTFLLELQATNLEEKCVL